MVTVVRAPSAASGVRAADSCESGYTLVIFIMVIAIMAIMMTIAVQSVEFQMKREKEAELIFRGEQYVEGIRLFRAKYGRPPTTLKEMWEANPKVLRKKWVDPFTGEADWEVILVGESEARLQNPNQPAATPTRTPVFSRRQSAFNEGESARVGPINGVRSRNADQSIKVYKGKMRHNEWWFVLEDDNRQTQHGHGSKTPRPTARPTPGPTGTPGI